MNFIRFAFSIIITFCLVTLVNSQRKFDFKVDGKSSLRRTQLPVIQTKIGHRIKAWLGSNSTIGRGAFEDFQPPDRIGFEYPIGSGIEHLFGAGIWIGAIVDTGRPPNVRKIRSVTTGYDWGPRGYVWELYGHQTPRDTFYKTSIYITNTPNKRHVDDDNDGKVDEDDLDGYDNDGDWEDLGIDNLPDSLEFGCKGNYNPIYNPDPAFDNYDPASFDSCRPGYPRKDDKTRYTQNNGIYDIGEFGVDEDYGAVSENDVYMTFVDTFRAPSVVGHIPLGIKVWQKSYSWGTRVKEPIIIVEYYIINVGRKILDSVWVGVFNDIFVGPYFLNPNTYTRNYSAYIPELRTAYADNAIDKPSTPYGVTVLGTPKPLDSIKYTFQWTPFEQHPTSNDEMYRYMSSGVIKPNEPIYPGSDTQFLLSFGPFDAIYPNDTLKMVVALISGFGVDFGVNTLRQSAVRAIELYSRGYKTPEVPPSPPLRITYGDYQVTLNWRWRDGDPKFDPMETWDDSNKYVDVLDSNHWRRRNPPLNKSRGGRIFEGFRVWRSESPVYNPNSFALIKQFDVDDDLEFEYQTGIEYELIDSNLVRGRRYWYAVTSFSIPGAYILEIPDTAGGPPIYDTLVTASVESDIKENATMVQLSFKPSTDIGQVKVVPNPYRTDMDYTYEGGGWEGLGRFWSENKRVIWFIHLPPKCTIRIFSLTGDLVNTIEHNDENRKTPDRPPGQEEWNLLSQSGRAIASGVYVYTVESDYGRQIGKFVIIR